MKHVHSCTWGLIFFLVCTGCSSLKDLHQVVPRAEFHEFKIKKFEPRLKLNPYSFNAKLTLGLCFRFHNPYKKELTLPSPDFEFKLRNREVAKITHPEDIATLKIPRRSYLDVDYDFLIHFDDGTLFKAMLGKDNPYSFKSTMVFNLRDYIQDTAMLSFIGQASPFLSNIFGQDVTRYKLEIVYADTIRVPLPPRIEPDLTEFPRIGFQGQMESFSVAPITENVTPFVDAFENSLAKIPFGLGSWFSSTRIMDVLSVFGIDLSGAWNKLEKAWEDLKEQPVIKYPGPRTTGVEIKIPVIIHNPNEFDIECPQFDIGIFSNVNASNSYNPFYFNQKPATRSSVLTPGERKKVWISSGINWNSGYTIPDILLGQMPMPPNPGIKGGFMYDLGYGKLEIPFSFGVEQIQLWR